jgi:tRNA(adenine34) deaminase
MYDIQVCSNGLAHVSQDPRLNHEFPVRHGVLADDASAMLRSFFADRR